MKMKDVFETPESLKSRWQTGEWLSRLSTLRQHAEGNLCTVDINFIRSLGLPLTEGRLDLRGIPLYIPWNPPKSGLDKAGVRFRKGSNIEAVDFSFAQFYHSYFIRSKVENCLFQGAHIESSWWSDTQVRSCDFSGSFLPVLTVEGRSQFHACSFDRTKIRHYAAIRGGSTVSACSFHGIDWRMVEFDQCAFTDCGFSGTLEKGEMGPRLGFGIGDAISRYFQGKKALTRFTRCDFLKLKVKHCTVRDGFLSLQDCVGFPTQKSPSMDWPESHVYDSSTNLTKKDAWQIV
jgi:uncharacterized protein YjbI with pentapeptide repeats